MTVFRHMEKNPQDSIYKHRKSLDELTNMLDNTQKSTVFLYISHQKLLHRKPKNKAINK